MPIYYDFAKDCTSNAATLTSTTHFRFLTIANQPTMSLSLLFGGCYGATAGGGVLRLIIPGTPGSGGTPQTPGKKRPISPNASTTLFNDTTGITPGAGAVMRFLVGLAQTGGMGGYAPAEPDAAIMLLANGGANGNMEIASLFNATGVQFGIGGDFSEA
jgi:hypothetical protein